MRSGHEVIQHYALGVGKKTASTVLLYIMEGLLRPDIPLDIAYSHKPNELNAVNQSSN